MTSSNPASALTVARSAIALASARDRVALRALLDPAIRVEWPYAGREPVVFDGVEAAMQSFALADTFVEFSLDADSVHGAHDGETVVIEAHSRGTLADGRRDYQNRYVFLLTVRNGRIVHWREYFNPIEGGRVFGKVG